MDKMKINSANNIMKRIILFAIVMVAYLFMYILIYKADGSFYGGYIGGVSLGDTIKNNIIYVIMGLVLYILPYEKIRNRCSDAAHVSAKLLGADNKNGKIQLAWVGILILYAIFAFLVARVDIRSNYNGPGVNSFWGLGAGTDRTAALVAIVIALAVTFALYGNIQSKWQSLCFVFGMMTECIGFIFAVCGNSAPDLVPMDSGCDTLIFATIGTFFALWLMYAKKEKRVSVATFCIALVYSLGFIASQIYEFGILDSDKCVSDAALINEMDKTGSIPNGLLGYGNVFAALGHEFGIIGITAFATAFLVMLGITIYGVHILMEKSMARAMFVLGIFLIFSFVVCLTALGETGIISHASIRIFMNNVWIPCMILALRMFNFRKIERSKMACI